MQHPNKTTPPDKDLFFKSTDANDIKLGQLVSSNQNYYAKCKVVLLGCPQDEGVRRNNGRPGAAKAPDRIRECLYKFTAPDGLKAGEIFDAGNTLVGRTLEETHDTHESIVAQFIKDNKRVIVLGGGNDISYPDCKALSKTTKKFIALNVDSHFDVRENKQRNSGTPYRQLLEERILEPTLFYELASQPFVNSEKYRQYLGGKKVPILTLAQLRKKGLDKTIMSILKSKQAPAIFWGIDMDSVRSSDAPGVSASYPTGLTAEEILSIATIAGKNKRSRILEITEVNPIYDIDNRTCKLAALVVYNFLKGAVG